MNPIEMLRTLVEGLAEGERVKKFGYGYREKARGQELENQKAELEVADLPETMKQRHSTAQIAITAEEERHLQDIQDAKDAGLNPSPEAIAGLKAAREKAKREADMARVNAQTDREKVATEAARQGLPSARPTLDTEALDVIAPRWNPDSSVGPQPGPTNASIEILTKKMEEDARLRQAQARVSSGHEFGSYQYFTDPVSGETYAFNAKTGRRVDLPTEGAVKAGAALPDVAQREISGKQTLIQNLDIAISKLDDMKRDPLFGPVVGRLRNIQINRLGGIGASPQEQELAVRLRALVRDQSFAEGGKQLTPTEKEEFTATLPQLTDTVEQAIIKARLSKEFLGRALQNRMGNLSPDQKKLIPGGSDRALGSQSVEEYVRDPATGKLVLKRTQ